jgi:hypothetical protein
VHGRGAEGLLDAAPDDLAGERPECLAQVDRERRPLTVLEVPDAVDARRHDPQVDVAPLDLCRLVGLPVGHRVLVRDDARAGLQGQEAVPHAEVDLGQEEQGDDTRVSEVLFEDVPLDDPDPVGQALHLDQARGELRQVGVVLDADGPGAEGRLRCGDGDPAVAGAQVEHEVLRRHLRHREHGEDDGVERRHPRDVLPGASPRGRVRGLAVGARARLGLPGGRGEEQHGRSGGRSSQEAQHGSGSRGGFHDSTPVPPGSTSRSCAVSRKRSTERPTRARRGRGPHSQGGMIGGMRVKTSVTLDERVLKAIDKTTTRTRSRSRVIEDAAREFLARRARGAREARDLAILNDAASALNEEMDDVLGYQADV